MSSRVKLIEAFKEYSDELRVLTSTSKIDIRELEFFERLLNLTATAKGFLPEEIKDFLAILANCFEGPGLIGILRVKDQLRFILEAANAQIKCNQQIDYLSKTIFDSFFEQIKRHPEANHKFNIAPYKETTNYPLYSFHLKGKDDRGQFKDIYKRYGLRIHRSLMHGKDEINIEYTEPRKAHDAFYKYCLSARIIIDNFPTNYSLAQNADESLHAIIAIIIKQYGFSKFGSREGEYLRNQSLTGHSRRILQILTEKYFVHTIDKRGGYTKNTKEGAGPKNIFHLPPKKYFISTCDNPYGAEEPSLGFSGEAEAAIFFNEIPEEALDTGESPCDYEDHTMVWQENRPKGDHLQRGIKMSHLLAWDSYPFFWDRRFMQFNHYKLLMEHLDRLRKDTLGNHNTSAAVLFYMLLISTGQDPVRLTETQIITKKELEKIESIVAAEQDYDPKSYVEKLFFNIEDDELIYVFKVEDIGWHKNNQFFKNCIRTSRTIRVVLPPELRSDTHRFVSARTEALNSITKKNNFLFADINNECKPLGIQFFQDSISDFNKKNGLKITPEIISRSFFPFFVERYGIDPVIASYICGAVRRQERAQIFYTCISEKRTLQEHGQAISKFIAEMAEEDKEYEYPDYIAKSNRFYGSRCVPAQDHLRIFFETVINHLKQNSFEGIEGVKSYHNLYTVYTYIALQFATGLRPLRDPALNENCVVNDLLHIHDKSRRVASESHVAPLPETILSLLKEIRKGNGHLIHKLKSLTTFDSKRYQEIDNPLFFIIDGENTPEPVSPKGLRLILDKFHRLSGMYAFPANAPRHYLRTALFNRGLNRELIDSILGHHSSGREFFNVVSTKRLADLKNLVTPCIQEILHDIGIKPIEYRLI